jgi:ClpP class serine protease
MFLSYYYSSGYCTYDDIRAALALADADPNVKRIILNIDSPGGYVSGLLETVKAIEATAKPVIARASCALSAAYALAAACDRIEAINEASEFGCLGVAVMYYVDPEHEVTLTNTDSPEKRPDPTTDAGKASIVRYLDATNAWFSEAIARGRSAAGKPVTAAEVNADFGRGATLMAADARKRGMIDGYVAQRTPASNRGSRAESESEPTAPQTPTEAVGQESTMNKKLLAQTLGLAEASSDEAFEAGIVALADRVRTAEAAAKVETDKAATAQKEAEARVKTAEGRLEELEAEIGVKGEGLLGAVKGLLATKKAHEELVAKKAEDDKAAEQEKRAAVIKRGIDEGKLTPATVETLKSLTLADLEAFVNQAPRAVPAAINQPKTPGSGSSSSSTAKTEPTMEWNGKKWGDLKPSERAALKKADIELYNAMRSEALAA